MIDEYGVELVVNADYAVKNNLHSIKLVRAHLENAYIIPCDIWCERNPFHRHELYSWYMVSDLVDSESNVRVNRKMELVNVPESSGGNAIDRYLLFSERGCRHSLSNFMGYLKGKSTLMFYERYPNQSFF